MRQNKFHSCSSSSKKDNRTQKYTCSFSNSYFTPHLLIREEMNHLITTIQTFQSAILFFTEVKGFIYFQIHTFNLERIVLFQKKQEA